MPRVLPKIEDCVAFYSLKCLAYTQLSEDKMAKKAAHPKKGIFYNSFSDLATEGKEQGRKRLMPVTLENILWKVNSSFRPLIKDLIKIVSSIPKASMFAQWDFRTATYFEFSVFLFFFLISHSNWNVYVFILPLLYHFVLGACEEDNLFT